MLHDTQTLLERIRQLETKLKYLEQHHQRCSIHKQSLTARPGNENKISSTEPSGTRLTVISFIPQPSESKQARKVPQWLKTAVQVIKDVPSADDWDVKRREANLFTVDENYHAIAAISGGVLPSRSQYHLPTEPDLGPIDLARAYARITKLSEGNAAFTCRLHSFHELVFVSLCAVLEASGYPVDEINETMRIYVSHTEDINLKRLRHGALWANSAICRLAEAGWGDRATELFLLCGWSAAKYAAFGQNRKKSLPFFVDHLKRPRYISASKKSGAGSLDGKHDLLPPTRRGRVSYSIPAFIKIWFGDWFEVSKICQYLGYDHEHDSEPIAKLCQQYITLQKSVTAPEEELLRKRKADTTQSSNRTKEARIHEPDAEVLEHPIPTNHQSAHGQTDTARAAVSLREQQNLPNSPHTTLSCMDRSQDNTTQLSNRRVLLGEDGAMQGHVAAVGHAVSSEHDQHLDGTNGATSSLDWDGLEIRGEQVESNPLQQLCVTGNSSSFDDAFIPGCQLDINETVNAGNNLPLFDYANAHDLNNIAFDYTAAYDLNFIAFDYANAYNLNNIAFDYNASYDPSNLSSVADTACSLPPSANPPPLPEDISTDPEPGLVLQSL
ncbi:hypothetical protein BKA65DRAFT_48318 [Rhexocercosporidium sp. MPI-PUGE-AT-0058]|nr:hypothetical protein BKA65DRAFT_48318 [Rhexocercosporidium sp. MPI-PUGE-AT-0058]